MCVCISGMVLNVTWHQLYILSCVRDPQYLTDDDTHQKNFDRYLHVPSPIKRLHAEFSTALSTGAQLGEKPISYHLIPDIHIMWYLCSFWYLLESRLPPPPVSKTLPLYTEKKCNLRRHKPSLSDYFKSLVVSDPCKVCFWPSNTKSYLVRAIHINQNVSSMLYWFAIL